MGEKRAYKPRRPGGGRRKSKPEYDAGKILKELMDSSVVLYEEGMSLQAIADELGAECRSRFGSCLSRPVCMHGCGGEGAGDL